MEQIFLGRRTLICAQQSLKQIGKTYIRVLAIELSAATRLVAAFGARSRVDRLKERL